MVERPLKITFAEMRDSGVRGVLVQCWGYTCGHSIALMADHWPDDLRLSDIGPQFVCKACGKCGADVRPNFNWNIQGPIGGMGYR
jgi:hypothetical protein